MCKPTEGMNLFICPSAAGVNVFSGFGHRGAEAPDSPSAADKDSN